MHGEAVTERGELLAAGLGGVVVVVGEGRACNGVGDADRGGGHGAVAAAGGDAADAADGVSDGDAGCHGVAGGGEGLAAAACPDSTRDEGADGAAEEDVGSGPDLEDRAALEAVAAERGAGGEGRGERGEPAKRAGANDTANEHPKGQVDDLGRRWRTERSTAPSLPERKQDGGAEAKGVEEAVGRDGEPIRAEVEFALLEGAVEAAEAEADEAEGERPA